MIRQKSTPDAIIVRVEPLVVKKTCLMTGGLPSPARAHRFAQFPEAPAVFRQSSPASGLFDFRRDEGPARGSK